MTQFTKLKKLLDELEAKFEALEALPATYEATALAGQIAAAPGKRSSGWFNAMLGRTVACPAASYPGLAVDIDGPKRC